MLARCATVGAMTIRREYFRVTRTAIDSCIMPKESSFNILPSNMRKQY
jgi:hypothetical protein